MKYTPLYFFRSNVVYFAEKGPIKVQIFYFLVLRSNFTKFLSFLKQKISFSSNFAPLFGIMRHNSSILFLAETFSKSSLYQITKLVKLHLSNRKSKIFTVVGSFCKNQIKFQLKKYRILISNGIDE